MSEEAEKLAWEYVNRMRAEMNLQDWHSLTVFDEGIVRAFVRGWNAALKTAQEGDAK